MRFLYFAFSSCSEVKSMIYLAAKLHYLNDLVKDELISKCNETQKLISGFIKSLKTNEKSDPFQIMT